MPGKLAVSMFVDACGWEVVRNKGWFLERLHHRQRVESIFGYSSACVPAILTGRLPNQNDHWSCFYYSPSTSPFKALRPLKWLPGNVFDRGRVRHQLSKVIAKIYGYTGYFQIYSLPFDTLSLYDYSEKKDIFKPGGINRGTSIFDDLAALQIPYHVSDWRIREPQNIASLTGAIETGSIDFAFLYAAELDALLHDYCEDLPRIDAKLRWYADQVETLLDFAGQRYDEVRFAMFSDHGMAKVQRVVNLMPQIDRLGLQSGRDYAAVYDSTMLRFWFLNAGAESKIRAALPHTEDGRFISDDEHRRFGTYWDDRRYGHAIYALEPGVLLAPSHMGALPMKGMHGYRPDHPDSDASMLSNFVPSTPVNRITDFYGVMREMAVWASS